MDEDVNPDDFRQWASELPSSQLQNGKGGLRNPPQKGILDPVEIPLIPLTFYPVDIFC